MSSSRRKEKRPISSEESFLSLDSVGAKETNEDKKSKERPNTDDGGGGERRRRQKWKVFILCFERQSTSLSLR